LQHGGDEDGNLARVGSLARDEPILLLIETLGHRRQRRFGVAGEKVRERRPFKRFGRGRRGEYPREMKTHERIGPTVEVTLGGWWYEFPCGSIP
jgi:hypothetical protein